MTTRICGRYRWYQVRFSLEKEKRIKKEVPATDNLEETAGRKKI
jgi:hypothetical protein